MTMLWGGGGSHTSLSIFWAISLLSLNTRYRATQVMSTPWPMSPNMTANRKGKVMMVYGAGDKEVGRQASHGGWGGGAGEPHSTGQRASALRSIPQGGFSKSFNG